MAHLSKPETYLNSYRPALRDEFGLDHTVPKAGKNRLPSQGSQPQSVSGSNAPVFDPLRGARSRIVLDREECRPLSERVGLSIPKH
jgi:hypothetical protein